MTTAANTLVLASAENAQRPYAAPSIEINDLRLITLGGSVGGGDSGAATLEEPGGGIWNQEDDNFKRDDDEWV